MEVMLWEELEPYDGKLSRTVLRGESSSNRALLPGAVRKVVIPLLYCLIIILPFVVLVSFLGNLSFGIASILFGGVVISYYIYDSIGKWLKNRILKKYQSCWDSLDEFEKSDKLYYKSEHLASAILNKLSKTLELENTSFFLFDEHENHFYSLKHTGLCDTTHITISREHALPEAISSPKSFLVKDLISSQLNGKEAIEETMKHLNAEIACPFFVNHKLTGILFLGKKKDNVSFHEEEMLLIKEVARAKEQNLNLTMLFTHQEYLIKISKRMMETKKIDEAVKVK